MATINFGGDYKGHAYQVQTFITQSGIYSILSELEDTVVPSEWSVYDAEMMERIAGKIREYYKQPRIETE